MKSSCDFTRCFSEFLTCLMRERERVSTWSSRKEERKVEREGKRRGREGEGNREGGRERRERKKREGRRGVEDGGLT